MFGGGYIEFDMVDFQRSAMKLLSGQNIRRSRQAVKNTVRDVGLEAARRSKEIVDNEVSDSGRLAASIGYWDQKYLKKPNTESSPTDAHWAEFTAGNRYVAEFGSNVPYALPILLGFTMNETRRVWSTRLGQFITVKPFSFGGVFAYERAIDSVNADSRFLQRTFKKNMKELELNWR